MCHRHSAKDLPSVTLGKEHTASTVPANSSFAECFLSGTRQRLCRELKTTLGEKKYVTEGKRSRHVCRVSKVGHSAKVSILPCVKVGALGKSVQFAVCQIVALGKLTTFAVCHSIGTRQRPFQNRQNLTSLPSVKGLTLGKHAIFKSRMHRMMPRVHFAECFTADTRQMRSLPSVTLDKAATNNHFNWFGHSHVPHSNKHHIHHK